MKLAPAPQHQKTMVACRMCGAEEQRRLFSGGEDRYGLGGEFDVMGCDVCSFLWTSLAPDFDLDSWYGQVYWHDFAPPRRSGPSRARDVWRAWNGSPRPSRWVTSGKVLDIGCGPAYDTEEMREAGADVVGLDTSIQGLEAGGASVPLVAASATSLPFAEGSFDAVVMSQVLEHMREPEAALAEARRVLRHDGTLLILVPNARGLQRKLFGTRWINWHLPFHLWHFEPESIQALLGRQGFSIDSLITVSPGEWVLMSVANRWPGLKGPFRSRALSLLVRLVAGPVLRTIDLAGLGDCLVLQCRKARP